MARNISVVLFACLTLSACSTLPVAGPTGSQIQSSVVAGENTLGIRIVEVTDATALPVSAEPAKLDLQELPPPPTDMVGPGDVLSITIYEAGVPLFGGGTAISAAAGKGAPFDPAVSAQALPPARVSDDGNIMIPYAGTLHVSGKTAAQVEQLIRAALQGISQDPQVLVRFEESISNSVIVGGEVNRPGRLTLQTNDEKLSDVIALAGGQKGAAKDLVLRVIRNHDAASIRLSTLFRDPDTDLRAYPGDRLTLLDSPMTFSVLGASGRVNQVNFTRATMTLAEAIANGGGADPNAGDPGAVFVFREVAGANGGSQPVVYHFNMMRVGSYFLAQKFSMQDKDILYVGTAKANQPLRIIQIISQLFLPIATIKNTVN